MSISDETRSSILQPMSYGEYDNMLGLPAGPQLEGFGPVDYEKVINDNDTRYIAISDGKGVAKWPLLTPVVNFTEYVPKFFESRDVPLGDVYVLSLPGKDGIRDLPEVQSAIGNMLAKVATEREIMIVYGDPEDEDTAVYVSEALACASIDTAMIIDPFVDPKNVTNAAVMHYQGVAKFRPNEAGVPKTNSLRALRSAYEDIAARFESENPKHGKTILMDPGRMHESLTPDSDQSQLERLWEIYEAQFNQLTADHPSRQTQTREELEHMVTDPNTFTVAHIVDDEIVSFGLFVGDIDACDWLNTDYYAKNFPDEMVLYFPGIATDIEKQGQRYAMNIMNLITGMLDKAADQTRIVFQCTNISADYIPKIVEYAANNSGLLSEDAQIKQMYRYDYRGLRLNTSA